MDTKTIHPEFEVKGIVCPKCLGPLDGTNHLPIQTENGVTLRQYMGLCQRPGCEVGFEVVQIQIDGKWYIHWYQLHKSQPYGPRVEVVPLQAGISEIQPEPAAVPPLVVVGPGGEYRREIRVTEDSLLASVKRSCGCIVDCFDAMLSLSRGKDEHGR